LDSATAGTLDVDAQGKRNTRWVQIPEAAVGSGSVRPDDRALKGRKHRWETTRLETTSIAKQSRCSATA
jgi:hypothetical protein